MLQIRLSKGSSADYAGTAAPGGGGAGGGTTVGKVAAVTAGAESVTVACPDHLVLADLPVAKSLGAVTSSAVSGASAARTVGRRSRRPLGERVHICSRCDFPIAIYGRLVPCEHAFCLTCARSDASCYLCEERIQKIQSIKMMEGIFICAAPHCLKSFLKKTEFESHIQMTHANLLQSNQPKEFAAESDTPKDTQKQQQPESSTARGPTRQPGLSPTSSSQLQDREDRTWLHLQKDQSPFPPKPPNLNPKSDQLTEKADHPFIYPPLPPQQPNFLLPINMNQPIIPSQPFNFSLNVPTQQDGSQQLFGNHYQMQMTDAGPDQAGSVLGVPPAVQWGMGLMGMPFQQQMQMGTGGTEGFASPADLPPGGLAFLQQAGALLNPMQGVGPGDNNNENRGVLGNLQIPMQMPMPPMSMQQQQQHFGR